MPIEIVGPRPGIVKRRTAAATAAAAVVAAFGGGDRQWRAAVAIDE